MLKSQRHLKPAANTCKRFKRHANLFKPSTEARVIEPRMASAENKTYRIDSSM